ncbi:2-hydroxyacid dehydrogenase [Pseudomonas borbori]|uniref:Lactate dehydrogenase n=1 Tax=Pseudomonas borbori TaxID=289003 RepID=A0A1I5RXD3_9PSED|nr:2-hydroxyacid dehydrogenase [Pseudomonas borbori]SFP63074.1 Lactate dehydrogenase [Pseudomonas borbori]
MSKPKVLQIGALSERFNRELAECYEVTALWQRVDPLAFLQEQGTAFELLVSSARFGCSAEQLACLPNLRAICSFGVGYDPYPLELLRDRGIVISTTPDVLNDCVADLAMGLIIDTARQLAAADRFVRAGGWPAATFPLTRKVSGKKLGIVGLGRIGQAIARRAEGFAMPVRYHKRCQDLSSPYGFEADLLALARWADFLVLACPGGAATHHLIDADVLAALGPQGILVNISRGSVVDQPALVTALLNGHLGGAGLDVFEGEPTVPAELFALPNVVLLPHVGSGTHETRLRMEELVLANLQAFIDKGELLTPL